MYFILSSSRNGNDQRWYKFDDGEVTECKMDDEDEMKNQCFGGEYMGEVSHKIFFLSHFV